METRVQRAEFTGPVPPPRWLEGYEQIVPGAANRLISLAETEARHRRRHETLFAVYRFLSLVSAFLVAVFVLGAGIYFIDVGKSIEGLILLVAEVTALVLAFLSRRS